ncbi:MAG: hypothetical protein U0837_10595 [Dehalococcoidia bacterium]
MKNITVSVPDEVYHRARERAAEEGRSVSALVAEFLRRLTESDAEFARLEAQQASIQATIRRFSGSDRLTRDEVHARALGCAEVLSEDLGAGQDYGGVVVRNPFGASRA